MKLAKLEPPHQQTIDYMLADEERRGRLPGLGATLRQQRRKLRLRAWSAKAGKPRKSRHAG